MRFLYHVNQSTGTIENATSHTDNMETHVANVCVAGKGSVVKYSI